MQMVDLNEHVIRHQSRYSTGVLSPEVHWRLVEDLDRYAAEAGISPDMVSSPLNNTCGEGIINYVRRHRSLAAEGTFGLLVVGKFAHPVPVKLAAMAGAYLRNFIDARLSSVGDVVGRRTADETFDPEVLLVPDFVTASRAAQERMSRLVVPVLQDRIARGRQTVLGCYDDDVAGRWGRDAEDMILAHYEVTRGAKYAVYANA